MTIINPPGLAPPRGYAHGTMGAGAVLFVAGQIGWNRRAEIVSDRFVEQFDQAIANVLEVVAAAGGSAESVARLTIFVIDKGEYLSSTKEIGERYRIRMGKHFPAMTLVEVKGLLEPGARVEIEATAIIDSAAHTPRS
jgi:enamine deaminase RidA (YjgF/YER057c/UK114 family)